MKYVETLEIPLAEIQTNEYHLRQETKRKDLEGLAKSIAQIGLVHPIVVRATPEGPLPYALVAGERRFLAHQVLKRPAIRADVWEATEEEARHPGRFSRAAEVMTIVSNVQVEPLHPFEMGRRYIKWIEDFGMTEQEVADALDVSLEHVQQAIRPLKAIAPEVLDVIEKNIDKIQPAHIELLADEAYRTSPEGQMKIVRMIIDQVDKELVQRPARLIPVAVAVRRAEKARQRVETPASPLEPRAFSIEHSDEFKRKKLFDFIGNAELALADFNSAEIPESISLVDLKSIEARGERLGRAWPQAVKTLVEVVDRNAAAKVKSETGDDGANSSPQEAARHGRPRAKV